MGLEEWLAAACLFGLAVAYFVPTPRPLAVAVGWAVCLICTGYGVRYLVGDDKGRPGPGSFLPFGMALAGLKLALA